MTRGAVHSTLTPQRPPAPPYRRSRPVGLTRGGRLMGALLSVLVLVGSGAVVWQALRLVDDRLVLRERCVARVGDREAHLTPEQAGHAATIAAVGVRQGVGERGVTIGLATALQESKLRNLDHGDRDSLGLFQQRPSQGWGTAAQLQDPVYAATAFFRALRRVPAYADLPLTEAAQRVQRSGYPQAYADHEGEAAVLAATLTGRVRGAFTCALRPADVPAETEGRSGLTPRAAAVRTEFERVYGTQRLGGFAPGGVASGHADGSAHYDGRAIDIFYRPVTQANRQRGWRAAHWLVASADRLRIATVIYDDRIWTVQRSAEGWRRYSPPGDGPTNSVTRHLDHVHVDVLE